MPREACYAYDPLQPNLTITFFGDSGFPAQLDGWLVSFPLRPPIFLPALRQDFLGALSPVSSFWLELLAALLVVVDEELLDLFDDGVGYVRQLPDVGKNLVHLGDGDQAIVALGFAILLRLNRFDDTDQPCRYDRASRYRFLHQHEDVERVAVAGSC